MEDQRSGHIAVVGGGISGVATAYFLKQRGLRPEIIEAEAHLGGRAGSALLGDKVIDVGGKNIGRRYTLFRRFIAEHGEAPLEFFGINSSTVQRGTLRTIDSEKRLRSLYHLLRLVGPKDLLRLSSLAKIVRHDPREGFLGGTRFSKLSEERDHLPLSNWFGESCVRDFLRPLTLRMNGAEPDEYSFGCLGSNLNMVLDRYDQLTHGMADLLQRFAGTASVLRNTRVSRLLSNGDTVCGVELEHQGTVERRRYDFVVLALPAPVSAGLLPDTALARSLAQVSYYPVTLLVARYARPVFDAKVRAIVFQSGSIVSNAGCYGRGALDTVRYTLSGRKARHISGLCDPAEVLSEAERTLGRFVPVSARDRIEYVHRRLPLGLCGYTPYHHRLVRNIESWDIEASGVALTGDYVYGASIEACFRSARDCADRVAQAAHRRHVSALTLGPKRREATNAWDSLAAHCC